MVCSLIQTSGQLSHHFQTAPIQPILAFVLSFDMTLINDIPLALMPNFRHTSHCKVKCCFYWVPVSTLHSGEGAAGDDLLGFCP